MEQTELESFDKLLPLQCYCRVPTSTSPQMAIQVSIFDCGGIAITVFVSHKVVDATTTSTFIKSWAAFTRGTDGEIPNPEMLDAGSWLFPPLDPIPRNYIYPIERLWFDEGWCATRRFVFVDHAISSLKIKVKSKRLEHPCQAAALVAFLWKHATLASRAACGQSKPSVLSQSVNFRPRMKPRLPNHAIGNLHGIAVSTYNSAERDIDLRQLAYLAREAINVFIDQISLLQIGDTFKFQTDQFNLAADIVSRDDVEIFEFVSWLNTGDGSEFDFGWGPQTWSCVGVSRVSVQLI
ncbi:hypothetical protein V6N11_045422 [Hibiscus sabdariffa]|uniref:Uncharacterized protein n=1 Tax=Hibiscus sabdariffa TaxID=183260 RepID=A0ABR2Q0X3_9ROSI